MSKQKGIIHLTALGVLVILLAISLLIYRSKNSNNLSVEPPSLYQFSAYLNTTEGKRLLHTETFGSIDQVDKEERLDRIKSQLVYYNGFVKNAIISLQKDEIYFYDKTTENLEIFPLPSEVKNFEDDSLELFAQELNNSQYLINLSHNQKEHFTYLFNKKNSDFKHLNQFDEACKYIFCGGPHILKRFSDNDFLLEQGAGDACWNAGVIHRFNLKTITATKLLEYSNGCDNTFDSYFGMFEDNFITAKHKTLNSYHNAGLGPDQLISEVYLISLDLEKIVLIPKSKMPPDIDYISLNPDNNILYLHNSINNKYYRYFLETDVLETITKDQVIEPKVNDNTKDIIHENIDFLTIEVNKKDIGDIKTTDNSGGDIYIKDANNNRVPVLTESFLDSVKFEREAKENCPYQNGLVGLTDREFPFRFSRHAYEDSPRVLNNNEIIFVVISECSEYHSEKSKAKAWLLSAKQFTLNIRTGKIYLNKELDNRDEK